MSLQPLEQISKLQQQIEALKGQAVQELNLRRAGLLEEMRLVDEELERLTGKVPKRKPMIINGPREGGKKPDLQELKAILAEAPEKTISLRKEGYDVNNVKVMAEANPHLLRMGGKGPWPTVTLLK